PDRVASRRRARLSRREAAAHGAGDSPDGTPPEGLREFRRRRHGTDRVRERRARRGGGAAAPALLGAGGARGPVLDRPLVRHALRGGVDLGLAPHVDRRYPDAILALSGAVDHSRRRRGPRLRFRLDDSRAAPRRRAPRVPRRVRMTVLLGFLALTASFDAN